MRMKNIMIGHVTTYRNSMFRDATNVVQKQLEDMCKQMKLEMEESIQELHGRLSRDYLSVLVGTDAGSTLQSVPRVERMLRAEMATVLAKADLPFAKFFAKQPEQEGCPVSNEGSNPQEAQSGGGDTVPTNVKAEPL
jgi:hypothetical protein